MASDRKSDSGARLSNAAKDPTLPSSPDTPAASGRSLDPIESADTLSADVDGRDSSPPNAGGLLGGRYEILAELGRGGEGVVYRARDVRADTVVAIKMIERDDDAARTRLRRFRRELKMARKVTHPGVVRIHDLVELPGRFGLSMELVEGEDLSARIAREPSLSGAEIVKLADQLAHALAAAHAAGVTHRDLKPANIILRAVSGDAVITDFGISRLHGAPLDTSASENGSTDAPAQLTVEGAIIGTPHYMAPEQLAGRAEIGPPADVYAFGLVIREAATRRRLHDATTISGLREARGAAPPPLHGERADLPEEFTRVVDRCLSPDASDRYSSGDALCKALDAGLPRKPRSLAPPRTRSRMQWGVVGAVAAAGGVVAVAATRAVLHAPPMTPPAPAQAASGLPVSTPPLALRLEHRRRITFADGCEEYPEFAPDGASLFFDGEVGHDSAIFQLPLPDGVPKRLTTPAGQDYEPKVSPDGSTIAFRRREAKGVSIETLNLHDGTPPRAVFAKAQSPSWSRDGRSLWVVVSGHPQRIDLATGAVVEQLDIPTGYTAAQSAELSDGSLLVNFPRFEWVQGSGIALYPRDGRALRWLFHEDTDEVLTVTPGEKHVLIADAVNAPASELVDVPLDGSPTAKLAQGAIVPGKGLAISPDGRQIAWSTGHSATGLAKADAAGKIALVQPGADWTESVVAAIPGTPLYVALSTRGGAVAPWIVDFTGRELPRGIPFDLGVDAGADGPIGLGVSPDGKWIALAVTHHGIEVAPVDGSSPPRVVSRELTDTWPAFSRDGREIFYDALRDGGAHEIMSTTLDGAEPKSLLGVGTSSAAASPVDERIAYLAGPDTHTLVPMIFDRATRKRMRVSPSLGPGIYSAIHFTPDGKRVAVGRGTSEVVEVNSATGAIVRTVLFDGDLLDFAYVDGTLVAAQARWVGDIWLADLSGPAGSAAPR